VLLVKEADVLPVDGVVLEGTASINASALTGEARPVERRAGDRLDSGTVNVGAAFRMRAAARASESTYTGIVRLVEAAQQSKAPAVRLADRYAAVFVAIVAGVSRTARRGILVKGGGVLEALARAEILFLDKTGTLTSGMPQLARVATCGAWGTPPNSYAWQPLSTRYHPMYSPRPSGAPHESVVSPPQSSPAP
jgi:cation transport ATPase